MKRTDNPANSMKLENIQRACLLVLCIVLLGVSPAAAGSPPDGAETAGQWLQRPPESLEPDGAGMATVAGDTGAAPPVAGAAAPTIRVVSPNGGENWQAGSFHDVTWTAANLNPASQIYIYYANGGTTSSGAQRLDMVAGPIPLTQNSYSWRIPYLPTMSSHISVRSWLNGAWEAIDNSDAAFTITQADPVTTLYFPHVDTKAPWSTEIGLINMSPDQSLAGTLRGLDNAGQTIQTKEVVIPARGRRQIIVASEFSSHASIGYMIFTTESSTVQGYTKFSYTGTDGRYRAAVPAVKEINTQDIYIPHIDSGTEWWTGLSLVNTTASTRNLVITFNTDQSKFVTLNPYEHKAFTIAALFEGQPHPGIESAVIYQAHGVIGLELFGKNSPSDKVLDGLLLTDDTFSTLYYPHVVGGDWWTGIVAYNPSESAGTLTVHSYRDTGGYLGSSTAPIPGKGKYVGTAGVTLPLPAGTAWIKIESDRPVTGFELFGAAGQLAAYAGGGGTGAQTGIFPKIEKSGGWTGIAFVNTDASPAQVTLTAYNDAGGIVAIEYLNLDGHAKVVNLTENIFSQSIAAATFIAYSADRNVIGFQLNGTADHTLLDGLPGFAGSP